MSLAVASPERQELGEVTYRMTIRNDSAEPMRDLVLESRYGDPLLFPGSTDKRARQALGELAPGAATAATLVLESKTPGRHCCDFAVLRDDKELVWKSVCVEFVERQVSVELVGPEKLAADQPAEFHVRIVNVSGRKLEDVRAQLAFDPVLQIKSATPDAEQSKGAIAWSLAALEPAEGVQLDATLAGVVEETCVTATVVAGGVAHEELRACAEPPHSAGRLQIRAFDRADPIEVGDETAYVVMVTNHSLAPIRNVRLEAMLPEECKLLAAEFRDGRHVLATTHQADGRRVTFQPTKELAAGAHLVYVLQVRAAAAGEADFAARVTSDGQAEGLEAQEQTSITAGE